MSSGECQAGDNQGFPLRISQKLYSEWPGVDFSTVSKKIKSITVPNEYSVNWPTPSYNTMINVIKPSGNNRILQITGIDPYTQRTTMTYGNASYKCSNILSIVQNQHKFFSNQSRADWEVILSFQIDTDSKGYNPSSPDIILFCRPLVISVGKNSHPMWGAIDKASSTSNSQSATVDLSSIYAYNPSTLLPFITYQTCIPTKLKPSIGSPTIGSLRMRVNVSTQALYLNLSSTDLSTSVDTYTLPTNPVELFPTDSISGTPRIIQFKDSAGTDGFPNHSNNNLKFSLATTEKTDFDSVINSIKVQVPEAFLGKSLSDITSAVAPKIESKKRAYKCYTIDPSKDIVDGQIMVDPATGEKLSTAQAQAEFGDSVDLDTDIETGIMPGDVEYGLSVAVTVLGTIGLLGYLLFIVLKGRDIFNTGAHLIPGGINEVLYHILIFTMIFICLIVFGALIEKPAEPKTGS